MLFERESLSLLRNAAEILERGVADLPAVENAARDDRWAGVLDEVATRLQDNYPYAHPFYAGQMLKPPHPIARLAYTLSLWINPNNHALDGGIASSAMEKEAVAELAAMFGWRNAHLGHLTGGGTMANLEALWIASRSRPGELVVASEQAHYTHHRIAEVLGIPFRAVAADASGSIDIAALAKQLDEVPVGTVVATLGTTGLGAVDALDELLALRKQHGFRVHVDAAYGGYFSLTSSLGERERRAFDALTQVDSIAIDPHKHGLQPYGCGCVLFADSEMGRHYDHDSPYTYFSSDELHLGEISLECSRPGAAAVALWATQRLLPMERDGEFAQGLSSSLAAARGLYAKVVADPDELAIVRPDLDVVVWAPRAERASDVSALSRRAFDAAAKHDLHLAMLELSAEWLSRHWPGVDFDTPSVTCLRSVLMKPEHLDWLERIWATYKRARG